MKLIGKGSFTKAYLLESGKVRLLSTCPIKECMAIGWFPDSYLFPILEYITVGEYETDYYERPVSLKQNLSKRQWELYQILRNLRPFMGKNIDNAFFAWHDQFDTIPNNFSSEREALKAALDACSNYGTDIGFEISPRNVAVKGRKLVLLDCFYSISTLHTTRNQRKDHSYV